MDTDIVRGEALLVNLHHTVDDCLETLGAQLLDALAELGERDDQPIEVTPAELQ